MTKITDQIESDYQPEPSRNDNSGEKTSPADMSDDQQIEVASDQNLDGFNADDVIRVKHYDVAAMAVAASQGGVVPGLVENAHANHFRAVEMHGKFSMSNGGGSMEGYFRELQGEIDDDGKPKDEESDGWEQYAEAAVERRRTDEWLRGEHTLGSVTMTGEEWSAFSDELKREGPLRDWLVQQIMKKENKTKAEAQTEADRIALLAKMQFMPKDKWTDEMKALDRDLDAHPEERTKYEEYLERSAERRPKALGAVNRIEQDTAMSKRDVSVESRVDVFNTGDGSPSPNRAAPIERASFGTTDFPTAPDLQAHHEAALAATEPLDAPKPVVKVASLPAPTTAPGSGFDA